MGVAVNRVHSPELDESAEAFKKFIKSRSLESTFKSRKILDRESFGHRFEVEERHRFLPRLALLPHEGFAVRLPAQLGFPA